MRLIVSAVLGAATLLAQAPAAAHQDPILHAMIDELERARVLAVGLRPYYVEYQIEDVEQYTANATLGGLLTSASRRFRVPLLDVRVGDYSFDDSNSVFANYYSGARFDAQSWPIDDRYEVLRRYLWLATDRSYKTALEAISRKRAALKNVNEDPDQKLPDFWRAPATKMILPKMALRVDTSAWEKRIRDMSAVFRAFPEVIDSSVEVVFSNGTNYFVNNEGSIQRTPDGLFDVRVRALASANDGVPLRNAVFVSAQRLEQLPRDAQLQPAVREVAEELRALTNAPVGEAYSGPVLFEGQAAAQLFAQIIGENLRPTRRPVSDPARPLPGGSGEFDNKIGSRILPESFDIVDDPTQKEWRGRPLFGHYLVDLEGVPPQPVSVVEKGVLKSLLTTRQPVKGLTGTTGHARFQGPFGARFPGIGNLFVMSSGGKPLAAVKTQLIDMCEQQGKPYGLLVRKLDYPSTMSVPEAQALITTSAQSGGGSRPVTPPVLIYKVYADGREELVRGMRFRSFPTHLLRDIVAVSDEPAVFDFVNNGLPFAIVGTGGYVAPTTVVAPSVLFDEIELERIQEERSKPPIVPPPPIE